MGFRLVLKSVTLNDLERRNGHYLAKHDVRAVLFAVAELLVSTNDSPVLLNTPSRHVVDGLKFTCVGLFAAVSTSSKTIYRLTSCFKH